MITGGKAGRRQLRISKILELTFDTATGDENVIAFLNLNVCGSDGTSSCSIPLVIH